MDKYEYNLKLDQIKALLTEENYKDAAEIADTINWNKIKNVNALVKAGEVYEKVGRYEESREILLNAYERSPIGRTIIYRLAEVAIKMNDFDGALEYYDEFIDIAPHDNQKYVLKYNMRKAQGADVEELILILEEFKEEEYTEEWAYELAELYHKAGMTEKCIDACDELILWFGDGPYVEQALELKMLHQPLTKTQEQKYRLFCQQKDRKIPNIADVKEEKTEEIKKQEEIPVITENPEKFNTINLQEEIAKEMQKIMEETEQESVTETMSSVKNTAKEKVSKKEESSQKLNFQEILGEESDGQISLVTGEQALLEKQITGQMSFADILGDWENYTPVTPRTHQETEDIMARLNDVIPKMETPNSYSKINPEPIKNIKTEESMQEEIAAEERALLGQMTVRIPESTRDRKETIFEHDIRIPEVRLDDEPIDLERDMIEKEPVKMLTLTEEQKAIFSYFIPVRGMESQLCHALAGIVENLSGTPNSSVGNLIIQGSQGCGKTVLATSIVKVLQKQCGKPNGRIGKIDAQALNKKDVQQLLRKVSGGCLIIERAGMLSRETAVGLSLLLEHDNSGTFVILEDTAVGIRKILSLDEGFAKKFTEAVAVPIFTNDDFIGFAKSYANELGYVIDELAILALHNRISNIQRLDQATTLAEVKEIIDEAIEREARGGIRKAFNILTAKRYTDDDKIVLTEKDFE